MSPIRPLLRRDQLAKALGRDLAGESRWDEALEGVDAVIHLAARVHVMQDTARDPLAEFRAANVEGTARLAEGG